MNAELKAKWVAALRSGDYKQGIAYLRDEKGRYCCLGVLYRIGEGRDPKYRDAEANTDYPIVRALLGDDGPPQSNIQDALTEMNDGDRCHDGKRFTFDEIAQWIEDNL